MTQAEIERNYYRTLYENLALAASIFSSITTDIKLCTVILEDTNSPVACSLKERGLELQEKAQTLMLDIMEFKIKDSKIELCSRNNIGIKFSKRLDVIIDETEQYDSSCNELKKMISNQKEETL